jgi:hypothetical protein
MRPLRKLIGGLVVGLSATLIMEYASSYLYERESEAARQQEERGRKDEMPTTTLVRKLAGAVGSQLQDDSAQRLGMATHYAFGAGGGLAMIAVHQAGVEPVRAGLLVGMTIWALVDEGFNPLAGLTSGPAAFPAVTHMRAAGAHAVYGLVGGLLLAAGEQA